jgi:UDP-2,4-diacetamido-2,4,6-trideoxy-beta-L-altropyranose hydrolase
VPEPIILVADAGPAAGLGHLSRSAAVAVALRCRGIETHCYAYGAEAPFDRDGLHWTPLSDPRLVGGARVLVVDSYQVRRETLVEAARTSRLVVMHDFGDPPEGAALVVGVANESSESAPRLLGGPAYAALRPAFWGLPARKLRETADRVLVTTGGGQLDRLGCELAEAVAAAVPAAQVSLVRRPNAQGPAPRGIEALAAPQSLLGPLLHADLAVTAGGQTMLEAAATGTPSLALPLVENQRKQTARLGALGAVQVVDPPTVSGVTRAAVQLLDNFEARRSLAGAGQSVVDGYGALRVAFEIARLAEGQS